MLQSSAMPQMNPDAIMDMVNQSKGASPQQDMSMDAMQGMPPDMGGDMAGMPPMGMDPSMMGMDPSMMPPPETTSGYDDGEAMKLLQQLNLPQEAIDQLLSQMYSSSGQGGSPMGTSPAAEGQAGNMQLIQELLGPMMQQQMMQQQQPMMPQGMDPSMMVPPIPPQPPMPPMGGPPMPPQGMPPMPPPSPY